MSSTTNINDLPTDPAGGGNSTGNVSYNPNPNMMSNTNPGAQPQAPQSQPQQASSSGSSLTLDQTTINQIISGLQIASSAGATQLPSKDIPRSTEGLTHDAQIQPNYMAPATNRDYIVENETNDDIAREYSRSETRANKLDDIYDELQIPLLLGVLYFIFQLPVVKKYLFNYLPFLFHVDGNLNINGYLITSALFGVIYYVLSKVMAQLNRI
jgi:hypothetical protein